MSAQTLGEIRDAITAMVTAQGVQTEAIRGPGRIWLLPSAFTLATGLPLGAASAGTPGLALANSKAHAVHWAANATHTVVMAKVGWSEDLDATVDVTGRIYVSKSGATVGDACTMLHAAYNQELAALHDADDDFGGTTAAIVGNATAKTIQEVTFTLAAANLPATTPATTTLTFKPTDGTLGTDALYMHAVLLQYTKKAYA